MWTGSNLFLISLSLSTKQEEIIPPAKTKMLFTPKCMFCRYLFLLSSFFTRIILYALVYNLGNACTRFRILITQCCPRVTERNPNNAFLILIARID